MGKSGALGRPLSSTKRPNQECTMIASLLLILLYQGALVQSDVVQGSVEEPKIIAEILEVVEGEWAGSARYKVKSVTQQASSDEQALQLPQDMHSSAALSPALGPHDYRPLLASTGEEQGLFTPQVKIHEEIHGASVSHISWNDTKRLGFSGRPSCPARSPLVDERRRRAAAATGKALLESQLLQHQRWILLQQQRKGIENKTVLPQQTQNSDLMLFPPAARVESNSWGDREPRDERPNVSAEREGPAKLNLGSTALTLKQPVSTGNSSEGHLDSETQDNEQQRSCPRAPIGSPLLAKPVASTCKRPRVTDPLASSSIQAAEGANVGEGTGRADGMRSVVGGLETSTEEELLALQRFPHTPFSKKDPAAFIFRSIIQDSASVSAGSRGAAMGEGEIPSMTWVLGATDGEGGGAHGESFDEAENLLEAFEYSFSLHAEEVAKQFRALGLTLGHAPAGTPQSATLQFSFDPVPLHEQRVIRTELGSGRERLDETLRGLLLLTPAQVQLRGSGGGEVLSLTEEGRTVSGSLFDEWIRGLEGPEGAAALHVFSMSLEDLRVILALQEETGGPMSLITAEDWGEGAQLSPFLKPLGGVSASFLWEEDLDTYVGDPEEHGEDARNLDDSASDSYWNWLAADPAAW